MGLSRKSLGYPCALLLCLGCTTNESGNIEATEFGDLFAGEPERALFDAELDSACGSRGGPTDRGTSSFLRLPYLQNVTDRSAEVLWTTEAEGATLSIKPAAIAPTSGTALELQAIPPTADRTAPLPIGAQYGAESQELAPGGIYCYRVEKDAEALTDWTGFRTAPAPGETVKLAVMGDLGEGTADQAALLDQLLETPMQALLLTGDLAYPNGTLQQFEDHFFSVYAPLLAHIPVFPASGNHDYKSRDGEAFRQVFALPENGTSEGHERWYSFDWGDVHVAALDTEKVGATQAAWLDADLAASDARWKLVILHKPPYSSGSHGDTDSVKEHFVPVFERRGVDLVLAGHDHNYERFERKNGVTYVVTGGGGVGTRPVGCSSDTAFALAVIHMVYLEADRDRLTGWAIDATGQVFDTFEL